jgi:hypothetical protein
MVKTFVPVLKIVLKLMGSIALTINETLTKLVTTLLVLYLENSSM